LKIKHPRIKEVEEKVKSNQMGLREAAIELNVSYQAIWNHFKESGRLPSEDEEFEYYLYILKELIEDIKKRLDEIDTRPTDLVTSRILSLLSKEIRGSIRDLAELLGRVQTGIIIQFNQLNVRYNKLSSFMMASCCPDCKKKLLDLIEADVNASLEHERT